MYQNVSPTIIRKFVTDIKKNAEWKVNDKVWKNVTFIGNQYTIATENATESVQ